MKKENIHIIFKQTLIPELPKLNNELVSIKEKRLLIKYIEDELKPMASIEWAIPSLIAIQLFKPYFESFLGEMGKDHYEKVKILISQLHKKYRPFTSKIVTATQSSSKISNNTFQNNVFCVYYQIPSGTKIKIFMPHSNSEDKDIEMVKLLFDKLFSIYSKPKSSFAQKINKISVKPYEELYAIFNENKEEWEFSTLKMLIHKTKK
jgi:hypothetical protein